jgi:hypothetical protein
MTDPLTLTAAGAVALTEGIKFLYGQAGEALHLSAGVNGRPPGRDGGSAGRRRAASQCVHWSARGTTAAF